MKLNAAQAERMRSQLNAEPLPDGHPLIAKLNELFGDHTYFLSTHGLTVVEPAPGEEQQTSKPNDSKKVVVVNLANWTESNPPKLEAHEPELTDSTVLLTTDGA
ncbi:MAG TPA: hypothetical protein VMF12_00665 [Xanthobacteraceae bacterium]|nr:hypothetical protein [Xanthobacteraceae bacterium]